MKLILVCALAFQSSLTASAPLTAATEVASSTKNSTGVDKKIFPFDSPGFGNTGGPLGFPGFQNPFGNNFQFDNFSPFGGQGRPGLQNPFPQGFFQQPQQNEGPFNNQEPIQPAEVLGQPGSTGSINDQNAPSNTPPDNSGEPNKPITNLQDNQSPAAPSGNPLRTTETTAPPSNETPLPDINKTDDENSNSPATPISQGQVPQRQFSRPQSQFNVPYPGQFDVNEGGYNQQYPQNLYNNYQSGYPAFSPTPYNPYGGYFPYGLNNGQDVNQGIFPGQEANSNQNPAASSGSQGPQGQFFPSQGPQQQSSQRPQQQFPRVQGPQQQFPQPQGPQQQFPQPQGPQQQFPQPQGPQQQFPQPQGPQQQVSQVQRPQALFPQLPGTQTQYPGDRRPEQQFQQGQGPQQQFPQGQGPQQQFPQGQGSQPQFPQGVPPQTEYPQNFVNQQFPQGRPETQYPQGQGPQQQYPSGQFPQGQGPQQQYPPGQFPQRQFSQSQRPQTQYPQQQVPQEQLPRGQQAPEQIPQYEGSKEKFILNKPGSENSQNSKPGQLEQPRPQENNQQQGFQNRHPLYPGPQNNAQNFYPGQQNQFQQQPTPVINGRPQNGFTPSGGGFVSDSPVKPLDPFKQKRPILLNDASNPSLAAPSSNTLSSPESSYGGNSQTSQQRPQNTQDEGSQSEPYRGNHEGEEDSDDLGPSIESKEP